MKAFQNKLALASLALIGTSHAFAPPSTPTTAARKIPITARPALPVDQLADAATTALSTTSWDEIIQQSTAHSMLLADEAAATAAAAGEATGWWGSYINVFKSTLLFVHGTIDAPLRSNGFDQTWGVSIGLFTLSKLLYIWMCTRWKRLVTVDKIPACR